MNVSRLLVCLLVNTTTMLVIGRKTFNLLNLIQCLLWPFVNPYNVAVSRIVSDVFASDAP